MGAELSRAIPATVLPNTFAMKLCLLSISLLQLILFFKIKIFQIFCLYIIIILNKFDIKVQDYDYKEL